MDITSQMWGWCMERKIYVSAEHLPGKLNTIADRESRVRPDSSEWKLNPSVFHATNVQIGSMSNRLVCFKAHNTAPGIFQLETRPQLGRDQCSGSELVRSKMLCLPSFCLDREVSGQSEQGKSTRAGVDCTSLANTTLVSINNINADSAANTPSKRTNAPAESQERDAPSHPSGLTKSGRMGCVRSSLQSQGVSDGASKLILASWRQNTELAYSANWGRWARWCQRNGYNPLSAPIGAILDFLTHEFTEGKQYRTLNSYRSAISMTHPPIDGTVIGKHPLVSRLMRGIFNSRPPQPRYSGAWDVGRVLEYIRSLGDNKVLKLKDLTHKLVTIMALANASRASEIHALNVKYIRRVSSSVEFDLAQLTKNSRPGKQRSLFYPRLEEDSVLCPVVTVQHYLEHTKVYRKSEPSSCRLFLAVVRPFKPVEKVTIARWIKTLIHQAGVGDEFKAHSVRGAAATAASMHGMSVSDILSVADWSSDSTFKTFCYRPMDEFPKSFLTSLTRK